MLCIRLNLSMASMGKKLVMELEADCKMLDFCID